MARFSGRSKISGKNGILGSMARFSGRSKISGKNGILGSIQGWRAWL
jgi:hypothetical protein